MASDKDRIAKLESRATEAENALKQLGSYVELLKKKSGEVQVSEESSKLEAENEVLKKEIMRLKQELILEEIRNGVDQFPVPENIHALKKSVETPPQNQIATPIEKAPPTISSETKQQPKKKKPEKKDKGGGAGPAQVSAPVDVSRLDMRVGRILKAWKHPDADGLYVEEVDVGDEGRVRTVCSGLVEHVSLEQMQGRLGIFLCNLKTAKMRGVPSEGMIMCASTPEKVEILDPPAGSKPGDRVSCAGYEGDPDNQLNSKKKIFESIQPDLQTNEEGIACYKGTPWTVRDKGVCRSQTMSGTEIK